MMYGRKGTQIKVPKSSKSTQEQARPHRQAAQLDLIRAIDHLTSTTTRTQRYTRATVHPPARGVETYRRTNPSCAVMTCSILPLQLAMDSTAALAPARGRQKLCRRNAACAAEPRAHPCLRVLCMTACRPEGEGPRNAYPLQPPTCKDCSALPRLSC
jgi:hypothetical protein